MRSDEACRLTDVVTLALAEPVAHAGSATRPTAISCALVITAAVFLIARMGISGAVWATLCIMCVVVYVSYQGTKPLAVVFPSKCATVGSLAESILNRNYGAISDECQHTNAEEAWNTLRSLIVEQLGVRPDDVTREASFVEDLRVD